MKNENAKINYAKRGWLSLLAVPVTVGVFLLLVQIWDNKSYDWTAIITMLCLIIVELIYSTILFAYASKTQKLYIVITFIIAVFAILFGFGTFFGALFD